MFPLLINDPISTLFCPQLHAYCDKSIQALSPYILYIKGGRLVLAARMHKASIPFIIFPFSTIVPGPTRQVCLSYRKSRKVPIFVVTFFVPDPGWFSLVPDYPIGGPCPSSEQIIIGLSDQKGGGTVSRFREAQWSGKPASGFRSPLHVYRYSTYVDQFDRQPLYTYSRWIYLVWMAALTSNLLSWSACW